MSNTPLRGPGYQRMLDRLGTDKAEQLRQQVLHEQEVALAEAAKARPTAIAARAPTTHPSRPTRRRKR